MERFVNLLNVGVFNTYKNNILAAMRPLVTIWASIAEEIIKNCCGTTDIVPAYGVVERVSAHDDLKDD